MRKYLFLASLLYSTCMGQLESRVTNWSVVHCKPANGFSSNFGMVPDWYTESYVNNELAPDMKLFNMGVIRGDISPGENTEVNRLAKLCGDNLYTWIATVSEQNDPALYITYANSLKNRFKVNIIFELPNEPENRGIKSNDVGFKNWCNSFYSLAKQNGYTVLLSSFTSVAVPWDTATFNPNFADYNFDVMNLHLQSNRLYYQNNNSYMWQYEAQRRAYARRFNKPIAITEFTDAGAGTSNNELAQSLLWRIAEINSQWDNVIYYSIYQHKDNQTSIQVEQNQGLRDQNGLKETGKILSTFTSLLKDSDKSASIFAPLANRAALLYSCNVGGFDLNYKSTKWTIAAWTKSNRDKILLFGLINGPGTLDRSITLTFPSFYWITDLNMSTLNKTTPVFTNRFTFNAGFEMHAITLGQ